MRKFNKIFENVPEWVGNDIIINSSVYVRRNVVGKRFPKRSETQLEDGLEIFNAIKGLPVIKSYTKVANYLGTSVQREGLMERGLATPYFNELDLPGSHILISKDHKNSILINETDHLVFIGISSGFDFEGIFKSVNDLVEKVGETVNYVHDKRHGYLNSFLENCGFGFRFTVKLFVPGIFFEVRGKDLQKILQSHNCLLHGSFGEGSHIEGGYITVCNASDLMVEKELLIDNVKQATSKIYLLETECRQNMCQNFDRYYNDVTTSFGAMMFQACTSFEDALKHLPLIYVGAILGMFSTEDALKIRQLMFAVSPAELSMRNNQIIGKDELGRVRANLIGETLETMEMKRR